MSGDPRTFAPEVFARLTPREQKRVSLVYGRHHAIGTGADGRPSDDPASIARKSIRRGVHDASFVRTAPVVILLCAAIGVCIGNQSVVSTIVALALASVAVLLVVRILRRERTVNRWFTELYPDTTDA